MDLRVQGTEIGKEKTTKLRFHGDDRPVTM